MIMDKWPGNPFYKHGLTLIPAWMCNYIYYTVWDEMIDPFQNFNSAAIETKLNDIY